LLQRCFLVTGTDTGIGKTTVACGIAAATAARGCRVGVLKPIETGCLPDARGVLIPEDAKRLKYFSGCPETIDAICPYRFTEPLAPSVAAVRDGHEINIGSLVRNIREFRKRYDITLIEGAGGLLVPIWGDTTFADLAGQAQIPLLIVVGNRLGAINHAQLTAGWARAVGLETAGYIVNTLSPTEDLAAKTNRDVLADLLGPPLGVMPWLGEVECTEADRRRVAEAAAGSIAISALTG
jgi:dethiobiotin synthetase